MRLHGKLRLAYASLGLFMTALALPLQSGAQTSCAPVPYLQATITVSPPQPTSSQPFTITVDRYAFIPTQPTTVAVNGNTIDVTVTGIPSAFQPPPRGCSSVVVWPLAAGSYVVNFYIRTVVANVISPPSLVMSAPLDVSLAAEPIPTNSVPSLVMLAMLVATIGVFRRRPTQRS